MKMDSSLFATKIVYIGLKMTENHWTIFTLKKGVLKTYLTDSLPAILAQHVAHPLVAGEVICSNLGQTPCQN